MNMGIIEWDFHTQLYMGPGNVSAGPHICTINVLSLDGFIEKVYLS